MHFLAHDDPSWPRLPERDMPSPGARPLLTLAQWQVQRGTWPAGQPVAVELPNDADVVLLGADLTRLTAVVLQFPKWTDGRAYSQARLLRTRHRFTGDIRAAGDVVVDMAPLLQRCGFSSAQLRAGQHLETARRALRFFDAHHQGDVLQPRPRFAREAA